MLVLRGIEERLQLRKELSAPETYALAVYAHGGEMHVTPSCTQTMS